MFVNTNELIGDMDGGGKFDVFFWLVSLFLEWCESDAPIFFLESINNCEEDLILFEKKYRKKKLV